MTKVMLDLAQKMVHSKGWQVTLKQRKAMELLVAHSMLKDGVALEGRAPTSVLNAVNHAQWEAQRDFDKALKEAPEWLIGFEWEEGGIEDESWSQSWTIDPKTLPTPDCLLLTSEWEECDRRREAAIKAVCELEGIDPDAAESGPGEFFHHAVGARWEGESIIVTQSGGRDI